MSVVKDFLIRPMIISTPLNPACSVPPSVLAYAMLKSLCSHIQSENSTDLKNRFDWSVVMA